MKRIRKLNSILFDIAAGLELFIPFLAAVFLGLLIIALIVWAVKMIVKARKKAQISKAEEEKQTKI